MIKDWGYITYLIHIYWGQFRFGRKTQLITTCAHEEACGIALMRKLPAINFDAIFREKERTISTHLQNKTINRAFLNEIHASQILSIFGLVRELISVLQNVWRPEASSFHMIFSQHCKRSQINDHQIVLSHNSIILQYIFNAFVDKYY